MVVKDKIKVSSFPKLWNFQLNRTPRYGSNKWKEDKFFLDLQLIPNIS